MGRLISKRKKRESVYQFKIELLAIKPLIWRRIEVPASYSFWDFHVAIQDAMGWLDSHLHMFNLEGEGEVPSKLGIPDDEFEEMSTSAGWAYFIADYFQKVGDEATYVYDFGDYWEHKIILEEINDWGTNVKYPRCLDGKRACPPEDCGGCPGYYNLLETLKLSPQSEEYKDTVTWLKGFSEFSENYDPYRPEHFNPNKVHFDNPKERFDIAFN